MSQLYLPPVAEPMQPKEEIFDWSRLPAGECDLNYRVPTPDDRSFGLRLIRAPFMIGIPCLLGGVLLRDFAIHCFNPYVMAIVLLCACLMALYRLLQARSFTNPRAERSALLWFSMPLIPWITAALAAGCKTFAGTMMYVGVLALPSAMLVADLLATHAVYWMTAHPRNDVPTLLAWRHDWRKRWTGIPQRPPRRRDLAAAEQQRHEAVYRCRRAYRWGFILVIGCFLLARFCTLRTCAARPLHEQGFAFTCIFGFTMIVLATLRCFAFGSVRLFGCAVRHWLNYGRDFLLPSWAFQSPSGSVTRRRVCLLLALFLWITGFAHVTDHFAWVLFADHTRWWLPDLIHRNVPLGKDQLFLSLLYTGGPTWVDFCLAIVASILVPMLLLSLVLFVLTAPVIAAHHQALEAAGAYEQY